MNDLELLDRFRADVPPPTSSALARARNFQDPIPSRTAHWTWRLAPVAALATAVGVGVVVASPHPAHAPSTPSAAAPSAAAPPAVVALDAPTVLRLAASAAVARPALTARPGQFVYVESQVKWAAATIGADGKAKILPDPEKRREIWLPVTAGQTGLVNEHQVNPKDKAFPGAVADNVPLPNASSGYVTNLPTDAKAMRAYLYGLNSGGKSADDGAFSAVADTLREQYVPPKSVAALYQAAATIPGVTVIKQQVDIAGRHGIAVSRTEAGDRHDLIFDAKTYAFLGEREVRVTADAPFPAGYVIGWTAQLKIAIVDKAGQTP